MPFKKCEEPDCDTEVFYKTEEDLEKTFRKLKTHTGEYFRNVCRKCEAKKQRERRENKKRITGYDVNDFPGGAALLSGGPDDY
jgi:hypothetical protein